ncbi:MAG: SpoVA/SpoVAEb family sporulation membrane protein [Ruminococcus sp.]|nr:SpoVA/SpoVAEb family sporulation membrane protein [Ruminococcus sp.]
MELNMTKAQYSELYKAAAEKSKWWINVPKAFVSGGLICILGQVIFDIFSTNGFEEDISATIASVILVFLSVLLTGLGIYPRIAKHAGAGTLVPITGFANSVCAPALEFKTEGMITGLGAKIFIISGPVILYGTLASVLYGLIYYFFLR